MATEINSFLLTINRDLPLGDMIATGRYDWVNEDITADHFPVPGSGTTESEITLFHFDRFLNATEAYEEFDCRGYRAATIEELLALGGNHPDLQLEFPIVALGSVWRGADDRRYCPCLVSGLSGRGLHLGRVEYGWRAICRFAAVPQYALRRQRARSGEATMRGPRSIVVDACDISLLPPFPAG